MSPAALELRSVTVRYGPGCPACADADTAPVRCARCGAVLGCRRLSLDVLPGEVLGIVGESGSGKSTALACANLDLVPTAGRVLVGGDDVTDARGGARRRIRSDRLGIVYQTPQQGLDLDVTAGGNVAVRLLASGWRGFDEIRRRVLGLLAEVELPGDRADTPVSLYSGGMRQRVQLARALANSPAVLLLDEPTSGLDVSVQARILDLVRRIHEETRMAMLVVSHDLGVIRTLAQRLLVMHRGRVVEEGLCDQLLSDPQHPYTQLLVSSQL
ncbi:MAG TPA: ATP-binding cassette domain-containing protein [Candidatus Dormibacteraeota bacterium]|nr:ATP-binding cassette domain-containing protein [Candidatus Dormibacteraeota bacterium]